MLRLGDFYVIAKVFIFGVGVYISAWDIVEDEF